MKSYKAFFFFSSLWLASLSSLMALDGSNEFVEIELPEVEKFRVFYSGDGILERIEIKFRFLTNGEGVQVNESYIHFSSDRKILIGKLVAMGAMEMTGSLPPSPALKYVFNEHEVWEGADNLIYSERVTLPYSGAGIEYFVPFQYAIDKEK
ncbi:hypothetical protein [Puniceicoccus vermicola]|uniref:Uncharacterized protein n=1 Tax=Puniceicoccus vermicola TaxID=388746 RepID=A0A7X1AUC6_9BACT|nr:hypothetical protein [Puniceicoccus vermicola]MBC2600190.1 hypothetical protein [Puniceicoccus vermicola]